MRNNPITQLLGIEYPIIQGGMAWTSGHKLAAAVSNEGGWEYSAPGRCTLISFVKKFAIRGNSLIILLA